jgi:two-component sensor histidine kinase
MDAELGVGWACGIHPEDFAACMDTYLAAFVARRPFRMEYRLRRADGDYRWILDQGAPRFDTTGAFAGYVGSCVDITDMKVAQARAREMTLALRARLQEREILLRELHHRVKNNLQLIISMHNLQARLASGEACAQLREAQRRVRSIALVHERLCAQGSHEVELLDYTRDIIVTLQQAADLNRIFLEVDGDAVRLPIDQAVPCGLLISELVTNAFRHAFPDDRSGHVQVALRVLPSERLLLSVSDDGIGLPPSFDPLLASSVGFDLVTALASQLHARFEHLPGPGTRFELEFTFGRGATS